MSRLSIRSKLLITFMLLFAVVFSAAFYWFYQFTTEMVMDHLRQNLMSSASAAANLVSADLHARVYTEGLEDTPDYKIISDQLRLVQNANPLLAAAYTMVDSSNQNELIFVVSADENSETRARLGEVYDTSDAPEMDLGFDGSSADIEYGADEFGVWLSGYAPIRNAEGRAVAIVGVDMTAEDVLRAQANVRNTSIFVFLISFIGVFIAAYWLSGIITGPLEVITDVAHTLEEDQPFEAGSLAGVAGGSDEIAKLAGVFSRMAVQVQAREQKLRQEVVQLRIEIDEAKRAQDVSQIVDSEYFQDLKTKAKSQREKSRK